MDKTLEVNYLSHLPTDKKARILDFGCGQGRVLRFLEENNFNNFVGVDIDTAALNNLSPSIKAKTEELKDLNSFAEKYNEHFDFIILKDVIYYFSRDSVVEKLKIILRCLKPNGKILIEVFNGAQITATYTAAKDLGIKTIYTEASIQQLLIACDLRVITIFEQKLNSKGFKFFLYRSLQKVYQLVLRFIFILERGVDSHNPKMLGKSLIAVAQKV